MKNRNRQNTEMFSDISQIDPSEFYAQKRENKTNHFAIIDDKKINGNSRNNFQPEATSFLDSFEVAISDPATKQIFADVNDYQTQRKKKRPVSRDKITNEILSFDLDDDDTFVSDVFDSYDSKPQRKEVEQNHKTRELPNENRINKHKRMDVGTDDVRRQSILNDFVPTRNVSEEIKTSNDKSNQKIDSIASALDDVSQRHNELQHSIQIILDDVSKHKEYDEGVQSNLFKNTTSSIEMPFENDDEVEFTKRKLFSGSSEIVDLHQSGYMPTKKPTSEIGKLKTVFEISEFDDEDETEEEPFVASDFSKSFKNKYEFEYTDNTAKSKRFSDDFKPLFDDKYTDSDNLFNVKPEANDKSEDEVERLIVDNKPFELPKADDMEVELSKLKINLDNNNSDEDDLLLKAENLKQLEEIENEKRELEIERQKLEEERQKMADEFMEMSEREREALNLERGKIIEEAYRQKEEMMASAKAEIDLERKQLQEENEKLRQSLAETIRENQEFIDEQRNALIEAANKEKERLMDEHRNATIQINDEVVTNARTVAIEEAQREQSETNNASLINEIRDLVEQIREVKESDEQKFEQLKNEISDETRNAVVEAINDNVDVTLADKIEKISSEQKENFEELARRLEEAKQQDEIDVEMEAINVNRSYTEKIIDDIESDDDSQHEFIPIRTAEVTVNHPTNQIRTAEVVINRPTNEFTDVEIMRSALNVPAQTDFDFEEKRLEYQRDKVKEEIKREILQEIERMNINAVNLNTSIPTAQLSTTELETAPTSQITYDEPKVTLLSSDTVPELINRHEPEKAKAATRMYDFDLFDELGIEAFESNDTAIVKAITEQIANNLPPVPPVPSFPEIETIAYDSNISFRPQKTQELQNNFVTPAPATFEPQKLTPKLRSAQLVFNKKGKYDKLSTSDLVKNYAKDIKKKIEKQKLAKF